MGFNLPWKKHFVLARVRFRLVPECYRRDSRKSLCRDVGPRTATDEHGQGSASPVLLRDSGLACTLLGIEPVRQCLASTSFTPTQFLGGAVGPEGPGDSPVTGNEWHVQASSAPGSQLWQRREPELRHLLPVGLGTPL